MHLLLSFLIAGLSAQAQTTRYVFRLHSPATVETIQSLGQSLRDLGATDFNLTPGQLGGGCNLPDSQSVNARQIKEIKILEAEIRYHLESSSAPLATYLIRLASSLSKSERQEIARKLEMLGASKVKLLGTQTVILADLPSDQVDLIATWPEVEKLHPDVQFSPCVTDFEEPT